MTKIIQTIRENRTPIIISIVVGILLFYLQPILTFIGSQIVSLFVMTSKKFSNYYYSLVARNNPNLNSYIAAIIVVLLYGMLVLDSLMESISSYKNMESSLKKRTSPIQGTNANLENEKTNLELERTMLTRRVRKSRTLAKSFTAITFLFLIFMFIQQSINTQANADNISFRNRLTILKLHLGEYELNKLKAKWVQMKSSDDYKQIENEISAYEKKYNILK